MSDKVTVIETGTAQYAGLGEYRGSSVEIMEGPNRGRFVMVDHLTAEDLETDDLKAGENDVIEFETVEEYAPKLALQLQEAFDRPNPNAPLPGF